MQVGPSAVEYTVNSLSPQTEYELFMKAYTDKGVYSLSSDNVIFVTEQSKNDNTYKVAVARTRIVAF